MKNYINIFLTLVMPVSVLFTALATVYYSTDFAFSKAIRLGTIAGILTGISLSLLLALILLIIRIIRKYKRKSVMLTPTIHKKKTQTAQKTSSHDEELTHSDELEEKFMLLMDKELAYEVSLNAINHGKIGDIIHKNKDDGSILLRTQKEEIRLTITPLTKHSSEVHISSTMDNSTMRNIISVLKEKEHLFIQY